MFSILFYLSYVGTKWCRTIAQAVIQSYGTRKVGQKMKRTLSVILAIAMLFTMLPTAYADDDLAYVGDFEAGSTVDAEGMDGSAFVDVSAGTEDLSGHIFEEILGDGSDYQVVNLKPSEQYGAVDVSYIANNNCELRIETIDDDDGTVIFQTSLDVQAGSQTVTVDVGLNNYPAFYRIDAFLSNGSIQLSSVYSYSDFTHDFQDFLAMTVTDNPFEGQVILDYGIGADGSDNFAVVNENVKVIYVNSIDDVGIIGDGEDRAALFSIMEGSDDTYIFDDVVNEEVLGELQSGDKLLILPLDDVNNAKTLVIDEVEKNASLFDENGESGEVTVSSGSQKAEMEEFFDYVRINVTVDATTDDLDTSTCDEDIEYMEDEEEAAELLGAVDKSKSASKTFSVKKSISGVTVSDTLTLNASISFSINYSWTTLKSVTASATLKATNNFNIHASRSASINRTWSIGTIPVGSVGPVTFSIPISVTFGASFGATFDFTATQTASCTITAKYQSGSYYCTTSKSASSGKSIETEARVSVQFGIKPTVKISLSIVRLSAELSGEVGIQVTGTAQSVNDTSTYKHNCSVCLSATLGLYLTPSFRLTWFGKDLASKTWSTSRKTLFSFYVSRRSGKWYYGTGGCQNKQYLVTLTVMDKNRRALSGVTVKRGTVTLGTTNNSGKMNLWLNPASYVLKLSKYGYFTATTSLYVSSSTSRTVTMHNAAAGSTYFTMTNLSEMSDDDFKVFAPSENAVADTIFCIESAEDLKLLSEFAQRADRTTEGLRFAFNGSNNVINLGGSAWTPIGTAERPFKGELDGNGFVITGLSVNAGNGCAGLFGALEDALIHDLTLCDVNVTGGGYTGGFAGKITGGKIYDIAVTGAVRGGDNTGGIFGAMDRAELLNAYTTASVSGTTNVGGIAGSFSYTETVGQISNCYSAGTISGSGSAGGICGTVSYTETASVSEETGLGTEAEAHTTGIQYAYYLADSSSNALGTTDNKVTVKTYAVTQAQANGSNADAQIADEDDSYAAAETLLGALNNWYAENGAYNIKDDGSTEEGTSGSGTGAAADDGTDPGEELSGVEIPEASPNDVYNHWYEDSLDEAGQFTNGGYPIFGQKAAVYSLTVHYTYEDGREAYPSVVLYLTAGQPYDVDSYKIAGYHTNEDAQEYKGTMPAYDLEYNVIYVPDSPYDGSASDLTAGAPANAGTEYSVSGAADLAALQSYVAAGGNTVGVAFIQTGEIDLSGQAFTSIGTVDHPFRGTYDGQYLEIKALTTSMFGYLDGAAISAVSVSGTVTGTAPGGPIGAIAAEAKRSAISKCRANVSLDVTAENAGGIAGKAEDTTINECTVTGSVNGTGCVGGIAGNLTGGSIMNCANRSEISGGANAGGIAGVANDSRVVNNYGIGAVNGSGNVGGLIGQGSGITLENAYQAGAVSGPVIGVLVSGQNHVESIWYLSQTGASAGSGNVDGIAEFTADKNGIDALTKSLNAWVESRGKSVYLTWDPYTEGDAEATLNSDDTALPVFGVNYANWLVDLTLANGKLSYSIDSNYAAGGTIYIAVYTDLGKMITMFSAEKSAEGISVDTKAAYAKAFIVDESNSPIYSAVRTE